jgi:hypothetical protein
VAASLRVQLFGEVRAWRDTDAVQLGPAQQRAVFGVSKSAAGRIIDHMGPLLALQQRRRYPAGIDKHAKLLDGCCSWSTNPCTRSFAMPSNEASNPTCRPVRLEKAQYSRDGWCPVGPWNDCFVGWRSSSSTPQPRSGPGVMTGRARRPLWWAIGASVVVVAAMWLIATWLAPARVARAYVSLTTGPPALSADEVIGTWVALDGGEIVIHSDRTFTADRLPSEVLDDYNPPGPPRRGSGTWYLTAPVIPLGGPKSQIELEFGQLTGYDRGIAIRVHVGRHGGRSFISFESDQYPSQEYQLYRQ